MRTYLISYDIAQPSTPFQYSKLIEKIQSFGRWAKPLESVWIVQTSHPHAGDLARELREMMGSRDRIVVAEIGANWATWSVSKQVTDWLIANIR